MSFILRGLRSAGRAIKKAGVKSYNAVSKAGQKAGEYFRAGVKGAQTAGNTVLKAASDVVQSLIPESVKNGIALSVATIRSDMRDSINWLRNKDPDLANGILAFADVTGVTNAIETGLLTADVLGGHDLTEADIARVYPPYRAARELIESASELSRGDKAKAKKALKKAAVDVIRIAAGKAFRGSNR